MGKQVQLRMRAGWLKGFVSSRGSGFGLTPQMTSLGCQPPLRSGGSNEAYRVWKVEAAEVDIPAGTVERGAAGRV